MWKTAPVLEEKLTETGMEDLFLKIEMPLIYSLYRMEAAGVKVARQELKDYGSRLKVNIDKLEQEIYEATGETFNINSPKQLGEVLFEKMQLKGGKKTKTGYSTAADVLEKLALEVPAVQKILDYRQLTKLYSTYAEGLAAYIGKTRGFTVNLTRPLRRRDESAVRAKSAEHSGPDGAGKRNPQGFCAKRRLYLH